MVASTGVQHFPENGDAIDLGAVMAIANAARHRNVLLV